MSSWKRIISTSNTTQGNPQHVYSAGDEFIFRRRLVNSAVVFIGSGLTKVYSPKAEPISGRRFFYSAGAEFIFRRRLVSSAVVFIGSGLTKVYSPKAEPISGRRFFYSAGAEFVFCQHEQLWAVFLPDIYLHSRPFSEKCHFKDPCIATSRVVRAGEL